MKTELEMYKGFRDDLVAEVNLLIKQIRELQKEVNELTIQNAELRIRLIEQNKDKS